MIRQNDYIIRIAWDSFQRIKKIFPNFQGESMARYFNRLSKWLETMEQNDI